MTQINSLVKSQSDLARLIPNIVFDIEGEDPLFDKISVAIEAQRFWLEQNISGPEVPDTCVSIAEAIIAKRAFAAAAPEIDIVLTPNGFGVVSTSEVAPASKDRVDRLISQLMASAELLTDQLISSLMLSELWRSSPQGLRFNSSLFFQINQVKQWRIDGEDAIDTLLRISRIAAEYEQVAEELIIGHSAMAILRLAFRRISSGVSTDDQSRIEQAADIFFAKISDWISKSIRLGILREPPESVLWQSLRSVVRILLKCECLTEVITEEVPCLKSNYDSLVSKKGAMFF